MAKIRVTLSIGYVGAKHEDILDIPDEEWYNCVSDVDRDDLMLSYWIDWSNNYIDGGFTLIEGE